jgi:hypothetical protein
VVVDEHSIKEGKHGILQDFEVDYEILDNSISQLYYVLLVCWLMRSFTSG